MKRVQNPSLELNSGELFRQGIKQRRKIPTGESSDIDLRLAEVRHNVDLTSALNRPEIEGQRPEYLVGMGAKARRELTTKHV